MDDRPAGAREMQIAIDAGAKPDDVQGEALRQSKIAIDAGAKYNDVMKYWGWDSPKMNVAPMSDELHANLDQLSLDDHARIAGSPLEYMAAGFGHEPSGLLLNGKPAFKMPDNPSMFQSVMGGIGSVVGDLPTFMAGGAGGGLMGARAGPVGVAVGAGAGGSALTSGMREALTQIYAKNPTATWKDIMAGLADVAWNRVGKEAGKGAAEGAVGGAVAGPLGAKVAEGAEPLLGSAAATVSGKAAEAASFGVAATTVGDALEGRVPTANEVLPAVVLGFGFAAAHAIVPHGATARPITTPAGEAITTNIWDAYAHTGIRPLDLGKVAGQDVSVQEELLAPRAADGTRVTPLLDQMKLAEPKPYKTEAEGEVLPPGQGDSGQLYTKTPDELQRMHEEKSMGDHEKLVKALGGEDEAQEFNRLDRKQNSSNPERADEGAKEFDAKYGKLTPDQERLIYGTGETEAQADEIKQVMDAHSERMHPDEDVSEAGYQAALAIRGVRAEDILAVPGGKSSPTAQAAFVRLKNAYEDMSASGIPPEKIADNIVNGLVNRGGWKPGDAREVVQKFTEALRGAKPPVEPMGVSPVEDKMITAQGDDGKWEPPVNALAERAAGGGEPPEEPPEVPKLPGPDEPGPRAEFLKNEDYREKVIGDIVGEKPGQPGFFKSAGGSLRGFLAKFNSQLSPDRSIDRELGLLGPHTAEGQIKAPHQIGLEAMGRMTYGSKARTYAMFKLGTVEPTEFGFKETGGPSVFDAFDAATKNGGTTPGAWNYLLAGRTVEKAAQGINTGIPLDVAAAHMADPATQAKYGEFAKLWQQANQGLTHYYRLRGMVNDVREKALNDLNNYYVTFDRIMDPKDTLTPSTSRGTRTLRKMEGSDIKINDPASSTVANWHRMVAMGDQNARFGHLVGLVEMMGAADNFGLEKVDPKTMGIDLDTGALLKGRLEDEDGNEITGAAKEAALPALAYRAYNGMAGNENHFLYFRDGVPELWRSDDPRVTAITHNAMAIHNTNFLVATMRSVSRFITKNLAIMPHFWITATAHAEYGRAVAGETPRFPLMNIFEGLPDAIRDMTGQDVSELGRQFQIHGGATAVSDIDRIWKDGDFDYVAKKSGLINRAWNSHANPAQWGGVLMHAAHYAAQRGDFAHQLRKGSAPLVAHNTSATNSLDFREPVASAAAQAFTSMIPFGSVMIKDVEQLGRALQTNTQDRATQARDMAFFMARGISYLTIPAVGLAVINRLQDKHLAPVDRSTEIPQWQKDLHFNGPVDEATGYRMTAPKPYVLGYAFTALAERFVDWMAGDKPRTFAENMAPFIQTFMPLGVPGLLGPIAEQATNTKIVSGTPLLSDSMKQLAAPQQYGPYTSPLAIGMAKVLGSPRPYFPGGIAQISPIVAENYFKEWAPGIYTLAHVIDGSIPSPHNQGLLHDVFTKSFFITSSDYTPKTIEDTYTWIDKVKQSIADTRKGIKDKDATEASVADKMMAGQKILGLEKSMSTINQAVTMIAEKPGMSLADKQKGIDAIYNRYIPQLQVYQKQLQKEWDAATAKGAASGQ
jgi:hypothetical protein